MIEGLNHEDFNRGVDLFNRARFFDAHEVLEDVWRSLPRDQPVGRRLRLHVQGMVQLAVAFHHQSNRNQIGARSVLERAMRDLKGADRSFPEIDFDRLRVDLEIWRKYLDGPTNALGAGGRNVHGSTAPLLPKIVRRNRI